MTRLRAIATLAACFLVAALTAVAQEEAPLIVEALTEEGGIEFDPATGTMTGTNGVLIRYQGTILTADRVTANQRTGDAVADGKVRIQQGEQIWAGEHMRYNFRTRQMESEIFRTGQGTVFATGRGLHGDLTNRVYFATNAFLTADDYSEPATRIRAKRITIYPGKRIEAVHATLFVGSIPVFYLPFYARNLGPRANNFNFIPGYRNKFGPFLLTEYVWFWNEEFDGALHVDYRQLRGVGMGPDLNYHFGRWGDGSIRYYYADDTDPGTDKLTEEKLSSSRQRVYFSYKSTPFTNLDVTALVRYQGDSRVHRDFIEREYRDNPQPSTFLEVNRPWQNFSLDTYVQPQINDFFETVERLPDIRLTGFRQELGDSKVFYESESSIGYYQRRFADTNGFTPGRFAAARADTYHQLLLPQTFGGWLNLTPRIGGRLTYYSETTGPGSATDAEYRGVFNTGAELSFKASRVWPEARCAILDLDGLRHIVQPSLNYVWVPRPNERGSALPQFDYELPSLRLLPIEFPDYNAIDSIDSQNVIRAGLRNRLQTKRTGLSQDLLDSQLYTDWRLHPDHGQSTFADVYSDLTFAPRSWLAFESVTRYDINDTDWSLALHTVTLRPNNVWSWSISHFYVRDDLSSSPTALGVGNNLISSRIYYRLNENWSFRAGHHFEARTGKMDEQDYIIYRDLRSWTGTLSFRVRENGDFTAVFFFSLKAKPKINPGGDSVKPFPVLGG